MLPPEIVLLDGDQRHFRAAVLKARGYRIFATEHVVEVCLRWARGGCAALVIGPQIPWDHLATLCDWIAINNPDKPIILLSDRRSVRWPAHIAVVPTQPVQMLLDRLRALLPAPAERACRVDPVPVRNSGILGMASRSHSF